MRLGGIACKISLESFFDALICSPSSWASVAWASMPLIELFANGVDLGGQAFFVG